MSYLCSGFLSTVVVPGRRLAAAEGNGADFVEIAARLDDERAETIGFECWPARDLLVSSC